MEDIEIKKEEQINEGWRFLVGVDSEGNKIEYLVVLDKEYWEKLTDGRYTPKELIVRSFKFLLERESKESILKKFNLREINRYFSKYESEIKK